jgi:hypothetical protein
VTERRRTAGESLLEARRRKESALADLRSLEVKRRRGELVDRATVERVVHDAARRYRESWQNWPARISAELAASWQIDPATVHRRLDDVVRAHLTELADLTVAGFD